MGWCHEFGPDISAGCDHPMVADTKSCKCTACGVVCPGKFAGCATVWAAGPRKVTAVRVPHPRSAAAAAPVPAAEPVPQVAPAVAPAEVAANGAAVEGLRADLAFVARRLDEMQVDRHGAAVEGVRSDMASVVRRLDEMQVEALRTDLTWVVQRLDELAVALHDHEQQFERLATRQSRPRIADQGPADVPSAPAPVEPAPAPRPASTAPGPPAPGVAPAVVHPVAPTPAPPEQVDLAVPLDQALVRPVRPASNGEPGR